MDKTFNLVQLVRVLLKWKKHLIVLILLGATGSVIVSFLLPEYFKSTAVFYPVNPSLTDRQTLFSTESKQSNVEYFGSGKDADRILTIAQSAALSSYIVNKFNLFEHYDINPESARYPHTAVTKEFFDNYEILKTKHDALEVSVLDTDPVLAADMANEIVKKIDQINKEMLRKSKSDIMQMFEEKTIAKQEEVKELTDSLVRLTEKFDIVIKSITTDEGLIVSGNNTLGVEKYKVLYQVHESAVKELTQLTMLRNQYEASINDDVSSLQVVEKAMPAEKKSKPVRWLICVGATLAIAFFGVVGILLAEQVSIIKEQL